jgi:type IV pilus assembly protein PilE
MRKFKGFSLIELLIVLAIVAILAAIGTSMYTKHIRKVRRVNAIQTLLSMHLAEENYRASNSQYGTLAQVWGGVSTTVGGYYTLTITNVTGSTYTLTAQATGTQASDTENSTSCSSLVLTMSNGTDAKTPSACWLAT